VTPGLHASDRILVVDDDDDIREDLAEFLTQHGYEVSTARDGLEAVAAVERSAPSLVISDVRMPRGDGLQLVQELRGRAEYADLPILLFSAMRERRQRIGGLDRGADDYLSKPIDPDELLARVRVQLRHAHRRQDLQRRMFLDPLTGVLDRRGLMQVLRHEHERVQRSPEIQLSILLIDIDRFKALNDARGHQAGDQVLRDLAARLTATVRAVDHVARIGGDEFVVVTPDGGHAAATTLAWRLAELRIPDLEADDHELAVGLSIGVATLQAGESVDALLERADAEMYERKRRRHASPAAPVA
jgi:diguanylate cyclase (GGDEF)-like protein